MNRQNYCNKIVSSSYCCHLQTGREGHEMLAYFLVWVEKPHFYGQAYLKTLALTGFTRLFKATLSWQAQPIPWQAGLAMLLTALPDARVEGNQDSPCLVCLPNFRGVIMWIINVHFRLEMHFIFLTRLLISDNILH